MSNQQLRISLLALFVCLLCYSSSLAQTVGGLPTAGRIDSGTPDSSVSLQRASATITARASADRIRITAPSSIVQLHVEIYASGGEKLFDKEIRGGNVFDWHLQNGQAERVSVGDYVCVVTVRNIAGKITQKLGAVRMGEKDVSVAPAGTAQLTPQQSLAIGPLEENSSWTVLSENENQTTTVIANDGADGQITRGRGVLSFRIGDFFSGNDTEQMRLTEEGNLGIGTSKPKFKLDVAGAIRARQGFVFNDGSTLNVNDKGILTQTSPDGTVTPNVGGIGSQGRLAKWTDNGGTLGDSLLGESGNNIINNGASIQMTAAPSTSVDTNLIFANGSDRTMGVIASSTPSFTAGNGPYFAMRGNTYSAFAGQRGLFAISAGSVSSPTGREGSILFNTGADQIRMLIDPSGDVGIGTTGPGAKLDVVGNINTSTQYNLGGVRILSSHVLGTLHNLFVGEEAGEATTAMGNLPFDDAFFGYRAGKADTIGSGNTFIGSTAGNHNTEGAFNTFIGDEAGFHNTKEVDNTFVGVNAGLNNGNGDTNNTASGNTFVGRDAAYFNQTGFNNTFVGRSSGINNGSGSNNTSIGYNTAFGASDLVNTTTIGARAYVTRSNSLVLGGINGINDCSPANNCDSVNVGIGTTAPDTRLHVSGTGIIRTRINSDSNAGLALTLNNQPGWSVATVTGGQFQIFNDAIQQNALWINAANNNVGIGTFAPTDKLEVNGTIRVATLGAAGGDALCRNASNEISQCSSSLRYKTNINPFGSGLNLVRRLSPITFNWKQGGMKDVGLGAEDVEKVEPLLVTYNAKGEVEGVKYDRVAVVLINAVKEQQAQISEQQEQIKKQQDALKQQQSQIELLRKLVCSDHSTADICRLP